MTAATLPGGSLPLYAHLLLPTMALCAFGQSRQQQISSCVDGDSFKVCSRFPGGWGVRVVYRSGTLLSTETGLLAPLVTQPLPGRVAIAFLKVTQCASGVSHDLKTHCIPQQCYHKRPFFLRLPPSPIAHSQTSVACCSLMSRPISCSKRHELTRGPWQLFNVRTLRPGRGWCQQLSHRG